MARKYTGNTDGNSGKALPGTQKLLELCGKRWGFTNLGIWANRSMKNPKAIPGDPKWLSVHATGRAIDIGYTDRAKAVEACLLGLHHLREPRQLLEVFLLYPPHQYEGHQKERQQANAV